MARAVKRTLVGTCHSIPVALGTGNSFNSRRFCVANQTIRNPSAVFVGYFITATAETNIGNDVVYHTAIEYPAGVVHEFTVGGTGVSLTVPDGSLWSETDKIQGLIIPQGAHFWVLCHGLASGVFYSGDYFTTLTGSKNAMGTDLADLVLTPASMSNAGGQMAGPVALMGDVAPSVRSFALVGDSLSVGGGGYSSAFGGQGYMAGYGDLKYSYCHFGISGAQAAVAKSTYTNRISFMRRAGITDIWSELAVNDLTIANNSAATLKADLAALFALFAASVTTAIRIWQSVCTTRTSISGGGAASDVNQAASATLSDGRRQTFNTSAIALGITGQTGAVDFHSTVDNALNQNWWVADYVDDGVHLNQTGGAAVVSRLVTDNALA